MHAQALYIAFFDAESERVKADNPKLKHSQLQQEVRHAPQLPPCRHWHFCCAHPPVPLCRCGSGGSARPKIRKISPEWREEAMVLLMMSKQTPLLLLVVFIPCGPTPPPPWSGVGCEEQQLSALTEIP